VGAWVGDLRVIGRDAAVVVVMCGGEGVVRVGGLVVFFVLCV
jgi:hypothetical protein